jgi:hypothetical protein
MDKYKDSINSINIIAGIVSHSNFLKTAPSQYNLKSALGMKGEFPRIYWVHYEHDPVVRKADIYPILQNGFPRIQVLYVPGNHHNIRHTIAARALAYLRERDERWLESGFPVPQVVMSAEDINEIIRAPIIANIDPD